MKLEFDTNGRIAKLKSLASSLAPEDIRNAVKQFNKKNGDVETFDPSTTYDLIVDGTPYPPKAIFGLALSKLFNQVIYSYHFTAGINSPCFTTLERLGFQVVPKSCPSKLALKLYGSYSRKEIASLFDPDYKFTKGSGRWGSTGIVSGYPETNDHVFIVSLDKTKRKKYNNYLTEDGLLFWNSQNKDTPDNDRISSLVNHKPEDGTIYLFMRTQKKDKYTFFGPLSFNEWNPTSSNPVHFFWNLLSWPLPANIKQQFSDHIREARMPGYIETSKGVIPSLQETKRPQPPKAKGQRGMKSSGSVDWAAREQSNRLLGDAGEEAVIAYEKERLTKTGRKDLADKIEHVAKISSSAGYDIKSFNKDGTERLIEVKTTTGGIGTAFYISSNEVKVSAQKSQSYWIYRLFNFNIRKRSGGFYRIPGPVKDNFSLTADTYKAFPKEK